MVGDQTPTDPRPARLPWERVCDTVGFVAEHGVFDDRADAGHQLARRLADQRLQRPLVCALPRGGIPVAEPVCVELATTMWAVVARKLCLPGRPEFGIGAICEGSELVTSSDDTTALGVSADRLAALAADEWPEVWRRVEHYRDGRPLPEMSRRDVVLVDDGLATGVTAEAALRALRERGARRLLLAVPVCATDSAKRLGGVADEVVCLRSRRAFRAV